MNITMILKRLESLKCEKVTLLSIVNRQAKQINEQDEEIDRLNKQVTSLERGIKLNDWALNFVDTITNGMNSDTLIRHKWPEEKPEEEKSYLTRAETNGFVSFQEIYWSEQLGWHTRCRDHITHWWNLPEVE